MRLIDADKLRFRHTVKCNSNTTRPYTLNCISFDEIQNAPTIKALPIDVLDGIRAEIEQIPLSEPIMSTDGLYCYGAKSISIGHFREKVFEIIDKYKAERSE